MSRTEHEPAHQTSFPMSSMQTLRWRLLALFGLVMLVMLLTLGLGIFYFTFRTEQNAWQGRHSEAARNAATTVASFIQRAEDSLVMVGFLDPTYLGEDEGILRDVLQNDPSLMEIVCLDEQGNVLAGDYKDSPLLANLFTVRQSSWFIQALAGEFYVSDVQISLVGKPYLILAVPSSRGGVVAARLRMDMLWHVVAGIGFGESGEAYVVGPEGRILAYAAPNVVLSNTSIAGRPELAALLQAPDNEWQGAYVNFHGRRVLGATAAVPRTDWVVITEIPQSEAFAVSRAALVRLGSGMLAFTAAAIWATSAAMRRLIFQPLDRLQEGAERIGKGDLDHRIDVLRRDEIGRVSQAFNHMAGELRNLYQQLADRSRDLERRSRYLEASAEVGRAAATVLDPDRLARQVVDLIRERFDLYYVGLFLVDEEKEWAWLRAGTGEPGRAMKARGHRIRVGEGMIGWSIANRQARVALEAGEDAVRLATAELPETRSEAALPLRSRGNVLGALSVQGDEPGAFDEDTLTVLQTMADQVAVALDNARLFAESRAALEAERLAYGEIARQAWKEAAERQGSPGYVYAGRKVEPSAAEWRPEMVAAAQGGRRIQVEDDDGVSLALPLKVRDQVVGVLDCHKSSGEKVWSKQELALLEALVEDLSTALESARLYQDIQHRAVREQLVGEVTAKMRETLDMESVLETATELISEALGLAALDVRLGLQTEGEGR